MTSFDPISAVFEMGRVAIEKIWPDPAQRAEQLFKLEKLKQDGDIAVLNAHVQLMLGQIEVNKIEASKEGYFVKWRPFVGWVGGIGLAYQFIAHPLLIWLWFGLQAGGIVPVTLAPPPVLDTSTLYTLLTGMLGMGALRSVDKFNKTETNND